MLSFGLVALAALAQLVSGQTVQPPANTPQCLLTCSAKSCPTSQLDCICVTELSAITSCVLSTCDTADQTTAAQIAAQICGTMHFKVLVNF